MGFIFEDGKGGVHRVGSGQDMLKALGQDDRPMVFITDENGGLVGAGIGIEGAQKSQPLIKSLRDAQPMAKSFSEPKKPVKTSQPKVIFKKSTGFSDQLNELNRINKSLAVLQKSMNVGVSVSDDGASDDIWSVVSDLDTRMSAMEANIKNISDFIANL
jgi:hypothetical protein